MTERESACVTTFVEVSPKDAFDVFTEEVDLWWRRGPRFREGGATSELRFEQDAGGRRLVEQTGKELFEIGRVQVWEPGKRLVLEYRMRSFSADEKTQLEIRFEPRGQGTRVTLEHRGWETLRAEHPARRTLSGTAFTGMIALYWGDLLTSYRQHKQRALSA